VTHRKDDITYRCLNCQAISQHPSCQRSTSVYQYRCQNKYSD